jgi:predicted enzyme related to lactoylglutathione lyase
MTSSLKNTTVDCADPYALATFWSEVLGIPVHPDDEPGDDEVGIPLDDGQELLFVQVPEPKTAKNRMHLCLEPRVSRDHEVDRLLARGATMAVDRRHADGTGWAVLADPEGNEFCILRNAAEREATATSAG